MLDTYPNLTPAAPSTSEGTDDVCIYNRVLSQDEIKQNFECKDN